MAGCRKQDPARDNRLLIREILKLREQQAKMHGYANFAQFATADTMAGSPDKVMALLEKVWASGKGSIERERAELLQAVATSSGIESAGGGSGKDEKEEVAAADAIIAAWDWRYYAEKVRVSKYDLDEGEVKPYFSLDCMVQALFDCALKLFGVVLNCYMNSIILPLYNIDTILLFLHDCSVL